MNDLRVCAYRGCLAPKHYENCLRCFGFGWLMTPHGPVPAIASESLDGPRSDSTPQPCPGCGSTLKGLPAAQWEDGPG